MEDPVRFDIVGPRMILELADTVKSKLLQILRTHPLSNLNYFENTKHNLEYCYTLE